MIQLDKIEIASFELFSSYPKEFQISAADAEKSKWHIIGTFEADISTKKKQIFEVDDDWRSSDYMFKFIKFEMLSFHGDEPQCTLTWLKVFGFGQFNPRNDDDMDHPVEADPGSNPIGGIINGLKKLVLPGSNDKPVPIPEDPELIEPLPVISIDDSYYDCWFQSAIFCFCREDCVEFNESPFFDIYVGPYQPATPQLPIIPKNETLPDVSGSNESDKLVNNTEKNDTKIEMPKQAKKEDPGQVAFKNQIKEFEANLSRVGDYLEKLSSSYKVDFHTNNSRIR